MPAIIYKNKDGVRIPSVTTILGVLGFSKDALLYWAWDQGSQGKDWNDRFKKAADIGTIAHAGIEADIKGEPFDLAMLKLPTDEHTYVINCLASWNAWKEQNKLEIKASEQSLVSEEYQFGGTIDCCAVYKNTAIIDFKTSKAIYGDYLIQIAAYGRLWNENHPEDPVKEYHILRLSKDDGSFHHHRWTNLDEAWEGFIHARALYDLGKKLKDKI